MADLQSCYFCGAPDDLGEYAVVPPRLGGGDRSVVLCPDCKTKLLRAIEPLIERAEAGAAAGGESDGGSGTDPSPSDSVGDSGITMSPQAGAGSTGESESGQETTAADASAGDDADDEPPSYRRAMRMLSNRPFPMDRSEVESMLANAYDLEREGIEAVLDHAESEGRLVIENGQLREP